MKCRYCKFWNCESEVPDDGVLGRCVIHDWWVYGGDTICNKFEHK